MQAVVNHQYKYIMCYSAKVGCTSQRLLYMALHGSEINAEQAGLLVNYHNLNEVFPFDTRHDYSSYFKFCITRNPYGRIISAFLDQFVYARNQGVDEMLASNQPVSQINNFIEFLKYLKTVPDGERDSHFQTQAFFQHDIKILTTRRYFKKPKFAAMRLNYVGDIASLDTHLKKVYRRIFKRNTVMRDLAIQQIVKIQKRNSSFYGSENYNNASEIRVNELAKMVYPPRPQDFLNSAKAKQLIQDIYARDFELFNYNPRQVPHKKPSPELAAIPKDFDWQTYLLLSPDLQLDGATTEPAVIRHYLEFGQYESDRRHYKIKAPEGFAWQDYLETHADLRAAGIDSERDAIIHYLSYGKNEGREIK